MKGKAKFFFLIAAICCNVSFATAQNNIKNSTDSLSTKNQVITAITKPHGPRAHIHEFSLGFRISTTGWSVFADNGKSKIVDEKLPDRFFNLKFWQIEFSEKKSPREIKNSSGSTNSNGSANTYIFGKINNFYVLKLGYGFRKMIAGKPTDMGVASIHWVNTGGFVFGFLKPYYLRIAGDPVAIKYTDATRNDFLNANSIEGSAGFAQGISELKFIPGVHFKSAFHFDFSSNLKNVIAIEAGVNGEYYTQNIPIMATTASYPYFIDVFLSVQVGRRW